MTEDKNAIPWHAADRHCTYLEVDALGIAATLNVEHTAITPAVLVIANERAVRVS
jgi:hypothetical protein